MPTEHDVGMWVLLLIGAVCVVHWLFTKGGERR